MIPIDRCAQSDRIIGQTENDRVSFLAASAWQEQYRLAHAAGWDAGNRSMKTARRSRWNQQDYDIACRTMGNVLERIAKT